VSEHPSAGPPEAERDVTAPVPPVSDDVTVPVGPEGNGAVDRTVPTGPVPDAATTEPTAPVEPVPPTTDPESADRTVTVAEGASAPSRRGLLTPGGLWGRWTLRARIRTGGFAQVWRATDDDGERAAIKFLLRPDSDVEARRFRRERDLGLRFQGRWLPRVLDADLDDLVPWIAFEYLDFPALDQLVASSGPLTGEALVIFTRDLWDAVLSLHGHDVAHRDLSARNVLIDVDDGRLRLIDLGSGTTGDGTLLTMDVFPASLGFAAPEQFDVRNERVGPAADLWSWAAVVYYAATGRTVFPLEPRIAYLDHLRSGRPPDLTAVPEPLRPALAAALRRDPAERRVDEIARLLPLRAHEAALRAAEDRLAHADAESTALRAAVADANRRLEQQGPDAQRMEQLVLQAQQAAADAAAARRQLEEATAATRQAMAASARATELRDELQRAVQQRDQALQLSDAQVRALQDRLRRSEAELGRLRQQAAQPPRPAVQGYPAHARPGPVHPPPPARPGPPARRPAPPPPAPAPRPRRRRSVGSWFLDVFLTLVVLAAAFVLVAVHPTLPQVSSWPSAIFVRAYVAGVTTAGAFALAAVLAVLVRIAARRPIARWLWLFLLLISALGLLYAYNDPSGAAFLRQIAAQAP
jgi:serine/threonine protein kinase